jgi:hypothetical protein
MNYLRRPFERTLSERAFDRAVVLVLLVLFASGPALTFRISAIPFILICCAGWLTAAVGLVKTWRESDNRVLRISSLALLLFAAALILGLLQTNGWQTLLNTNPLE